MKNTRLAKVAGFTLDQTILVVAVIAVLATIIISSVAWEVLNRANSTKLNAHLQQISDSIGSYYQDFDHVWPTNAAALAPYLAGYTVTGSNLTTPFGTSSNQGILALNSTGRVLSGTGRSGGSVCTGSEIDCYMTATITNIQAQEAEQANEAIDGSGESSNHSQGRLRWTTGTGSTLVTITYYALKR